MTEVKATHKYACVVLNYNNCEECIEYVSRIKELDVYDIIVVVDNNSTDNSYEELKSLECDTIIVIKEQHNRGYGAGNNTGVRIAYEHGCDIAFISNSDISYDFDCFSAIRDCFDIHEDAVVCSAIQRNGYSKKVIKDSAWNLPTYYDYLKSSFIFINRYFNKSITYENVPYMQVDCVSGAFLAVRIKPFLEVGGYDERIFLYCEESILGFRLRQKHMLSYIACQHEYLHFESGTISKNIPDTISRFRMVLNNRLFYMKNYLKVSSFKYVFAQICYRIAVWERYLQYYYRRLKK